jgi:hypothetical protein
MLQLVLGAMLASVVVAPLQPGDAPPKGPAPLVMVAHPNADGTIRIARTVTVAEYVPVTVKVKVLVNGREEERSVTKYETVTRQVTQQVTVKDVDVYNLQGRKLDPRDVKLTAPTPVLVSADGRPVDPLYLRLARENTLVIVSPALTGTNRPAPPTEPVKPPPQRDR